MTALTKAVEFLLREYVKHGHAPKYAIGEAEGLLEAMAVEANVEFIDSLGEVEVKNLRTWFADHVNEGPSIHELHDGIGMAIQLKDRGIDITLPAPEPHAPEYAIEVSAGAAPQNPETSPVRAVLDALNPEVLSHYQDIVPEKE